jgi:hypothetical protein
MPPRSVSHLAPVARQIFARLRGTGARRYFALDPDAWFRVVAEEPDGIWIEGPAIGDLFIGRERRFVFREDFELREQDPT